MEEQYLRAELNMRLSNVYSHSNSTITFVITLWSAVLALISVFYEQFRDNLQWLPFVVPLIFLITSCYIFFAAQKFNENLNQINKLATYYACFYNNPFSDKLRVNSWEYSTLELQVESISRKTKTQKVLTNMNGEYVFFSVVSMIIGVIVICVGLYRWKEETPLMIILCVYAVIIVGVNLALIGRIYVLTSLSHITEQKLSFMHDWIEYGHKKGVFDQKDIKERFGIILNAYQQSERRRKRTASKNRRAK